MPIFARVVTWSFVTFAIFAAQVSSEGGSVPDMPALSAEQRQLDTTESMLRNYRAKLMRSPSSRVNTNGPPVWIGAYPPDVAQDEPEFSVVQNANKNLTHDSPPVRHSVLGAHRPVRSRNEPLSEENCKTNRYWKQINETRDIYGHDVRIVHTAEYRQFAYIYECITQGEPCQGIVERLQSSCEMRSGWANMLHYKVSSANEKPVWGYVAVPHHCACRIYPPVNPFVR